MNMTGAEILIQGLLREGVDHIFGYVGATICPILDVLRQSKELNYTLVRTEQNAGHMASGYARVTGKTGVCMVTSGPGATNLITGIATAYMDSIPMVAITGQVPSTSLGRDIFQEVDISGAVSPFSKHSYLVKDAAQLPRILKEAFYIASTGRPGPVLIDIPEDIQSQVVENVEFPDTVSIRGYNPSVRGNDRQISHVLHAIASAQRPVICAGGGVFLAHAEEVLLRFARTTGIPVVTTMMGLSLLPTDDPLNIGMIGKHGNAAANHALVESDLLIMIGMRVADRAILSPEKLQQRMPSIHIDVDPAEIGKNMQANIPLVGNACVILEQLLAQCPHVSCSQWMESLAHLRQAELQREFPTPSNSVFPGRLLRQLGKRLDSNAAICVDVGQNQLWACKHLYLRGGRFLTSGGLGTMGYSLPAAIGVKIGQPDRQTVVICGDGSFQMMMNELVNLRSTDIKIVMLQNGVLGLVNQIQCTAPFHGPFGVELQGDPDFRILASAYGIPCLELTEDDRTDAVLDDFLSRSGPALLVVRTDPTYMTNA